MLFDSPSDGAEWGIDRGYTLMAQQLADGIVSAEEYEVSFAAHNSCLEKTGWIFSTSPAVWNPVDHLKLIRQGEGPKGPDIAGEQLCNEQFDYIDYLFQTTATPTMDLALVSAVQRCLDGKGVPYSSGATNLPEMVGPDAGGSSSADVVAACVTGEAKQLYPELPGLSIAF